MINSVQIIAKLDRAKYRCTQEDIEDNGIDSIIDVNSIFTKLTKVTDTEVLIGILSNVYKGHPNGCYLIDSLYEKFDLNNKDNKYDEVVKYLNRNLT
jgi:hypothetical protein